MYRNLKPCIRCEGRGTHLQNLPPKWDDQKIRRSFPCRGCNGTGKVPAGQGKRSEGWGDPLEERECL